MALVKDRCVDNSQACSTFGGGTSSAHVLDSSSMGLFGYNSQSTNLMLEEGSQLSMLTDPTYLACTSYAFGALSTTSPSLEASNNFKDYWSYSNSSSLLSFGQSLTGNNYERLGNEEENCAWIDSIESNYQHNPQILERTIFDSSMISSEKCSEISIKDNQIGEGNLHGLLHQGACAVDNVFHEKFEQGKCAPKRTYRDSDDIPSPKKKCGIARKTKDKSSSPSQDTPSIAAKNRRERISERLKILQDLIPNGTKVDMVTMLEKAITYVKFLQLQVKVLATDEFWPTQGGKAPEISQVKKAIDAILSSSNREINSSSHQ